MKITVTDKHILGGERSQCETCPVALALSEATGKMVNADCRKIVVGEKTYNTPPRVLAFMNEFDFGREVKPFTFELEES